MPVNPSRERWLAERTFRGADFDPEELVARKRALGQRVSVCLPTLDVAATVGEIVTAVRERWMGATRLVDQLAIVDCASADETVAVARAAGAETYGAAALLPEAGPGAGKGEALWKSLAALDGDLVVWIDSDLEAFDPGFVPGLLGPLLTVPEVGYVKGFYRRPLGDAPEGGGRVTEICARPLLNLLYPDLAGLVQPLAGEAAGRRGLLERLPFLSGYAVEIGLLIDVHRAGGLDALAQSDLGARRHRHQPTSDLGAMAYAIWQAALGRLAREGRAPAELARGGPYARPDPASGRLDLAPVEVAERPPIVSLPGYRARRAGRAA